MGFFVAQSPKGKAMKKDKKIILMFAWTIIIGIIIVGPVLAGQSCTFSVSCYMPQIVTTPSIEKTIAEGQDAEQETSTAELQEQESTQDERPDLIQQEEETTSEDGRELRLVTTVCAR